MVDCVRDSFLLYLPKIFDVKLFCIYLRLLLKEFYISSVIEEMLVKIFHFYDKFFGI